ncbi:hypothetical protein KP509_07G074000 [Ceratopteris richardii]|uniref:Uncharacterized protein n=1 Tax=Ceratopteris richardii TaxID=49495 RepID=A0A8T2UC60_CERRI|nr:hypothetical protein KP509_07G074000 [Ceratopteris richardii]
MAAFGSFAGLATVGSGALCSFEMEALNNSLRPYTDEQRQRFSKPSSDSPGSSVSVASTVNPPSNDTAYCRNRDSSPLSMHLLSLETFYFL